mmetsp:Transcript_1875/g.3101  ORF Transcript_1875/g.3101 Transcript_1875/m.3101 type:complete len:108 (+) Transcript_1875:777-1100(+)
MGRCSLSSVLSLVEYCDCLVIGYAGTIRPQDDTEMYNQYFLFGDETPAMVGSRHERTMTILYAMEAVQARTEQFVEWWRWVICLSIDLFCLAFQFSGLYLRVVLGKN